MEFEGSLLYPQNICDSNRDDREDYCHLGCDVVWYDLSCCLHLQGLTSVPKYIGSMMFRKDLPDYTA
jgi:hypothetical protein